MKYLVLTFESTHKAIKTEKVLDELEIEMIPTPRHISASCGIAIKCLIDDLDKIKSLMGESFDEHSACYEVSVDDGNYHYKRI